jgi:hypothetical protein
VKREILCKNHGCSCAKQRPLLCLHCALTVVHQATPQSRLNTAMPVRACAPKLREENSRMSVMLENRRHVHVTHITGNDLWCTDIKYPLALHYEEFGGKIASDGKNRFRSVMFNNISQSQLALWETYKYADNSSVKSRLPTSVATGNDVRQSDHSKTNAIWRCITLTTATLFLGQLF